MSNLSDRALTTMAVAKGTLNITGERDDLVLERAIEQASAICERYCDRPLRQRTFTSIRLRGPRSQKLYLDAVPIAVTGTSGTITITIDGVAQTVWKQESDGNRVNFDVSVDSDDPHDERIGLRNHLWRRLGWYPVANWGWPESPRLGLLQDPYNVVITYTGGYTTVPSDLEEACLGLVQKIFRDVTRQLQEVASVSTPFGGVSLLDTAIPSRVRMILDLYRRMAAVGV